MVNGWGVIQRCVKTTGENTDPLCTENARHCSGRLFPGGKRFCRNVHGGGSPWAFGRASLGSHRASADFIFSCLKCATASAPPPTTGRQMLTGQRSLVPDGRGAAALQGRRRVQALRVCVVSLAHTGAACTARDKRGPHSSRPHATQGKRGGPCTPALGCCFVPKKWQYFLFSFAYTPRMN